MSKKIIITTMLLLAFIAMPALSATDLLFSTLSVKTDEGKSFNVAICIDPKGVKNYTAKVELKYPVDLIEITGFSFSSGWMQVAQPGYDLIDNAGGVMIKTAGYPGGVSDKKTFGNISFKAKKAGYGTISVSGNSLSLDANNQNIFSSSSFPVIAVNIDSVKEEETENEEIEEEIEKELLPAFEIPEEIQEGYVFGQDLKAGDKSADVAYLQICLKSEGVYAEDITGAFDASTESAAIKFQEKYADDILFSQGFSKGTGIVSEITRYKLNEVCFVSSEIEEDYEKIPGQLFDIDFDIASYIITDVKELVSKVKLMNFGKAPAPIELAFVIVDENGKEIYSGKDHLVVETAEILTKKFEDEGVELAPGKYTVILKTLYNVDVKDEFRQDFEVVRKEFDVSWFWILFAIGSLTAILAAVWLWYKKRMQKNKKIK